MKKKTPEKQQIGVLREKKKEDLLKLKKELELKKIQCNDGQGGSLPIQKRKNIKKQIAKINTLLTKK